MSPLTHLLIGWSTASCFKIDRKGRLLATIAGVIPDIDGLGLVYDLWLNGDAKTLFYWSAYHHTLGHNIGFGLLLTIGAFLIAGRRWREPLAVVMCFHLHLLGDILGSRGPDGDPWPIPYLLPFSDAWQFSWSGQWHFDAWPNILITIALIGFVFHRALSHRLSPLELFSTKANRIFADTLRNRFSR